MSDLVNQAEETLLKSKGMAFAEIEETVFDLLSREIDYGEVFVQSTRSESFGLEEKYFKDSNFVIFSTLPIILTCLSKASQGNKRAAWGLF